MKFIAECASAEAAQNAVNAFSALSAISSSAWIQLEPLNIHIVTVIPSTRTQAWCTISHSSLFSNILLSSSFDNVINFECSLIHLVRAFKSTLLSESTISTSNNNNNNNNNNNSSSSINNNNNNNNSKCTVRLRRSGNIPYLLVSSNVVSHQVPINLIRNKLVSSVREPHLKNNPNIAFILPPYYSMNSFNNTKRFNANKNMFKSVSNSVSAAAVAASLALEREENLNVNQNVNNNNNNNNNNINTNNLLFSSSGSIIRILDKYKSLDKFVILSSKPIYKNGIKLADMVLQVLNDKVNLLTTFGGMEITTIEGDRDDDNEDDNLDSMVLDENNLETSNENLPSNSHSHSMESENGECRILTKDLVNVLRIYPYTNRIVICIYEKRAVMIYAFLNDDDYVVYFLPHYEI